MFWISEFYASPASIGFLSLNLLFNVHSDESLSDSFSIGEVSRFISEKITRCFIVDRYDLWFNILYIHCACLQRFMYALAY